MRGDAGKTETLMTSMILNCESCGRKHPLSDDDVAFFHPQLFCLACGAWIAITRDDKKLLELQRENDRDRRVPNTPKLKSEETVGHIRPETTPPPGMDGG